MINIINNITRLFVTVIIIAVTAVSTVSPIHHKSKQPSFTQNHQVVQEVKKEATPSLELSKPVKVNKETNKSEPTQEKTTKILSPSTPTLTSTPTPTNTSVTISELIPNNPSIIVKTNTVTLTPTQSKQILHANFSASGFRETKVYSYTTQIFRGDTVFFDASKSQGNIIKYEWDFGDGNKGEGKQISHTYTVSPQLFSSFNVILKVTDTNGHTDQTGGYYIWYIGEPRLLIDVLPVPDVDVRKYPCGESIKAIAHIYSPWGNITDIKWDVMEGSVSPPRSTDKILQSMVSDNNGSPSLVLDCNMVASDAAAQGLPGYAAYSFIVHSFRDTAGNVFNFDRNKEIGSLTIVSYIH